MLKEIFKCTILKQYIVSTIILFPKFARIGY